MKLSELPTGKTGTVSTVGGEGALRLRLLDMGLTPGVRVRVEKTAPLGDPVQLALRGYLLTLRREDAERITLREERV